VAARLINPNQPSDKGQAKPLVEAVKSSIKRLPRQVSADAGHSPKDAVEGLSTQRIDVCMPPGKMHYSEAMLASPRGRIPKDLSTADRMRCKLRTKKGKEYYALRKQLPEPVFGQIKQAREFCQFLLKGMLLSSENVTLIVQRICHPLPICILKGLCQGWSSLGLLQREAFGSKAFLAAMTSVASSLGLAVLGITRAVFLTLSAGASSDAGLLALQCP